MAYSTNTAASASALKTAIESFATTNGWTLSGGTLSLGNSYVKLSTPSSALVALEGSINSTFNSTNSHYSVNTTYCNSTDLPCVVMNNYPVTYYLFGWSDVPTIVCIVQYGEFYQFLAFGDIVKINDSAFTGGNYVAGSQNARWQPNTSLTLQMSSGSVGIWPSWGGSGGTGGANGTFFMPGAGSGGGLHGAGGCFLHAEIDGNLWKDSTIYTNGTISSIAFNPWQYFFSPNGWNNEAILCNISFFCARSSNLISYLGYMKYARFIRVDNYLPGDIITIGTDKWKVFPWIQKDSVTRNGGVALKSGTFGWAIYYDGP